MKLDEIDDYVIPKIKWYLKYRTQIWSTIFLVVGILGGSVATIQAWIPSLKTDTTTIEKKLEKIEAALDKLTEKDV
jgi:hypothetical protein